MTAVTYPYAIVRADAPPLPPEISGIRDAPVTLLSAGNIAAWISRLEPIEARAEDLRAHHEVVEAVCRVGPALPVRFGGPVRDEATLIAALEPRADALLTTLGRVGSKREVAITLVWREPADGARFVAPSDLGSGIGPGRRFMAERARRWTALEARRARATEIETQLAGDLREVGLDPAIVKSRIVPSPRVALSCAVLIEPAQSEDVMRRVRDWAAGWVDVQLHIAGPWPAYSFSDGE